ncbi:hypothetical protein KAK07_02750 [Ideonella sp. 4Y16]|uniref:hypothetical protein n=1 Tax=Ideonella alba TaxID=2824118 RepID=UPI001B362490|nr:hypothetical protein [Ideonella alba]MBQ0942249.1 hypothetical protein [Ideonella alba]
MLLEARKRWLSLPATRQMQLARCLAECRRVEWVQRVKQVVAVVSGLRRRNDSEGIEHLHNEPCVIFVVRRKLTADQLARQPAQRLPTELLTPVSIDGQEQPVAVPTDVQDESRLLGGVAQGSLSVLSENSDGVRSRGALAWVLKVGSQRYALAPIHVLSPLPALDGVGRAPGAPTRPRKDSSQTVARAADLGGYLRAGNQRSFDVQLAEVLRPNALSALFGGRQLSASRPYVRNEPELDALLAQGGQLIIAAPRDNPLRGDSSLLPLSAERSIHSHTLLLPLSYDFANGVVDVIHHQVMELQVRFGERTLAGDSGCAVLLRNDDDDPTLVGMHIAGNVDRGVSFVIPIWDILDPARYSEGPGALPNGPVSLVLSP